MVQEMKNGLLLCLKLFIWDRECVEEMGPNDLVDLIAFTDLEIRNCKWSCTWRRLETGVGVIMGAESKAVLACGVKEQ